MAVIQERFHVRPMLPLHLRAVHDLGHPVRDFAQPCGDQIIAELDRLVVVPPGTDDESTALDAGPRIFAVVVLGDHQIHEQPERSIIHGPEFVRRDDPPVKRPPLPHTPTVFLHAGHTHHSARFPSRYRSWPSQPPIHRQVGHGRTTA